MMTIHNLPHRYQSHQPNVDTQLFVADTLKTIKAINASIDFTKQSVMPTAGVQTFSYTP